MQASDTNVYDEAFFARGASGMRRSAGVIVPILMEMFHPTSVIDVGCGEGWWLDEFAKHGVKRLMGVEPNVEAIAAGIHWKYDLTEPLPEIKEADAFDLCLCLEVAEHLPEASADTLVASLCAMSDTIVFSAAIPKQGGNGHVNEQWPSYWADKFYPHGYAVNDYLRIRLWENAQVEPWYVQNTLMFTRVPAYVARYGFVSGPLDVVHPRLWEIYRGK